MFQFELHGGVPGNGLKVPWMERTKRIKYTRKRRERRRGLNGTVLSLALALVIMWIPCGSAELRRYCKRGLSNC
jgi:hypothetical protein